MTIPMMSPVIFYTLILGVVEVLQYFLVPARPQERHGRAGRHRRTFYNLYIYKTFFTFQNMSYGATLAWLLFGIALVVTLILFRIVPPLGLLRGRAMTARGDWRRPRRARAGARGRAAAFARTS